MQDKIVCPDCQTVVECELISLEVGSVVECQECGTELELLSLDPLKYSTLIEEK